MYWNSSAPRRSEEMAQGMYRTYFDFDENYFPQITDSSIQESESLWLKTYPHEKFLELLKKMERVMARQEKRSVWISGAYGTGKSQCAYTLKKILDVSESELRAYWEDYKALAHERDLLGKLLGHKQAGNGIVTVYRYAGTPHSTRDLLFAVQESVQAELHARGLYEGEHTLKESVIAWLEKDDANKGFVNSKLQQPQWTASFGGMMVEDIVVRLREGDEVRDLMERITRFSNAEGFTMMQLDVDRLIVWLTDVIEQNNIKLVFIWDEFSDYFRVNRESLADFQKLAELVNAKPFFFVPVTHETDHLFTQADETWKKTRDRFIDVGITLPDNIAFDLIGAAFKPKAAAAQDWAEVEGDLNGRLHESRRRVMDVAGITSEDVIRNIMPLHPMTALVLKHIASSFQSNQRSMFDFIKSVGDEQVKAFQYFIDHTGPYDEHPLLTVDQLWDFFYVRGKADLATHIRMILDTYEQQKDLREEQQTVLKAILILLAVDKQLGGSIELLHATDQNLSYVFEGDDDLGSRAAAIAQSLKTQGILIQTPRQKGGPTYDLALLSGDQGKIEQYKESLRKTKTDKLVETGNLGKILTLHPEGLKPRFLSSLGSIQTVTADNFTRIINGMEKSEEAWRFQAVLAFAKDDMEAAAFRSKIKDAARDPKYGHIIFIDALSTPLGADDFEKYVEYSAMAEYYQGNNRTAADQQARHANAVLEQSWKNRIYSGRFIVYTAQQPDGISLTQTSEVSGVLKAIVLRQFPNAFDVEKTTTEGYYKTNALKPSALAGINGVVSGTIKDADNRVLSEVWTLPDYWQREETKSLPISVIKRDLEARIAAQFSQAGQIGVAELCDVLLSEYGMPPCNLTAFLLGFLLRPYAGDPYRYGDAAGSSGAMTAEKLKEMLGDCIGDLAKGKTPQDTFIVQMTAEERAFYEITQKAWGLSEASCTSVARVSIGIQNRMKEWQLPLWCLAYVAEENLFAVVELYSLLQQKEGREAHGIMMALGSSQQEHPSLADELKALLCVERLEEGMNLFLKSFADGELLHLADELGRRGQLLQDIRHKFSQKYACLWSKETGEELLRELCMEYRAAHATNRVLSAQLQEWSAARAAWKERLNFLHISAELLAEQSEAFAKMRHILQLLAKGGDVLPEHVRDFVSLMEQYGAEMEQVLGEEDVFFAKAYAPYLDGLSEAERKTIRSKVEQGLFLKTKTHCNEAVRSCAEEYRRSQLKEQLRDLWKEKTGSLSPRKWSEQYQTPVLACVGADEYDAAQRVFSYIDHRDGKDEELKAAIAFLEKAAFITVLSDGAQRDAAFRKNVIGKYAGLLTDLPVVREKLTALGISPYDWRGHLRVEEKLKQLAKASYDAGGSSKVLLKIDSMDDATLKAYLKRLVADNMTVGMEILENS